MPSACMSFLAMQNQIQRYAWGSHTAIASLLRQKAPSELPQAELWMGAHPKAPSMVKLQEEWVTLIDLIERFPDPVLGPAAAVKFGAQLPFLFKVLAAAKPLSIQAHPSLEQARRGFAAENAKGIALDGPERNYRDANHKPECICALTPFWALNGFREVSSILAGFDKLFSRNVLRELDELHKEPTSEGLKRFLGALLMMPPERQKCLIADAMPKARTLSRDDLAIKWMLRLDQSFPGDIGVFAPLFLNLICLRPAQAMYLPAGQLHAYLDGVGLELMANSDNVLRGGLTAKHLDVPDLLRILNFEQPAVDVLLPKDKSETEQVYPTPTDEFQLSVLKISPSRSHVSSGVHSVRIVLCTKGQAVIRDMQTSDRRRLLQGDAVLIPACVESYAIEGQATLYQAAVPLP